MTSRRGDRDRDTYEDPLIVSSYGRQRLLQPPEQTVLDELAPELGQMDMLDLGVGAGRTAWHFAPRVKTYLGLDYARTMIERCKQDLPGYAFVVGDASRLDLADGSYDLVLFSYNGIDHLEPEDRQRALREMKRVLRPGGLMVFSSHNSNFLPVIVERFRFRFHAGLRETLRSLKWALVFNVCNPTLRFRLPLGIGIVNDGLHSFRSSGICYIRPDLQVDTLRSMDMSDISCAANENARYIPGNAPDVATLDSPWVYYRCRKPSRN